jgi:light-regulated signal transduction histidine kinase (bacteriophytochrome)
VLRDITLLKHLDQMKSIVESHGGRVRVESAEGEGSVFVVELPEDRPDIEGQPRA